MTIAKESLTMSVIATKFCDAIERILESDNDDLKQEVVALIDSDENCLIESQGRWANGTYETALIPSAKLLGYVKRVTKG